MLVQRWRLSVLCTACLSWHAPRSRAAARGADATAVERQEVGGGIRPCESVILHFKSDKFYIQGMDFTQVALFEVCLGSDDFFDVYDINDNDSVTVDMGVPNFEPSKIPLNFEKESSEYLVEEYKVGSLSTGNPHAIIIQDEIKTLGGARAHQH